MTEKMIIGTSKNAPKAVLSFKDNMNKKNTIKSINVQFLLERIKFEKENSAWLFLKNDELHKDSYPMHDLELDCEFDAIRSIN